MTDTFAVPHDWVSGYLAVEFVLADGRAATTYVILRAPPTRQSAILVQVPVNTWQAYNGWGGMSLYEFSNRQGLRANRVSFERPYGWQLPGGQSPLIWEYPTVRFLERLGEDVSYQTDVDTDRSPNSLLAHRLVVVNGHDEYWTKVMFDAFDAARNRGTNLAFMGANAAYWQIRYEDDARTIISYKSFADPIVDPALKTVRFRELAPPRYECTLIGIQHQGVQLNWPAGDYTVNAAALSDPWMSNTGFRAGEIVPGIVSVESDTVPGNESASSSCTHPLTVFFHRERGSDKDGNADAVRYTDPSGARVFASGSHQFSWALDSFRAGQGSAVPADTRMQRFMQNAFGDLLQPAPPASINAARLGSTISLSTTLHLDPRVSGVQISRSQLGTNTSTVVCTTSRGICTDHPPGHRSWTYAAVAEDAWGASASVQTAPVAVPNSPPTLHLRGPHEVAAGTAYTYLLSVHDHDGDTPTLEWRLNGVLQAGHRPRERLRFRRPGHFWITIRADDRHGAKATLVYNVLARQPK